MKGLILKDLYTMRQMGKIYLISMGCLVVWGLAVNNPSMLSSMLLVYGLMLLITTASWDEASHFNTYALTLPLSPKKLVQAKYLFALLLFAAMAVLGLVGGAGMIAALGAKAEMGYGELLASTASISCIYLMTVVVLLPCSYKFGVEKSRFLFVAIYLIVFACFAWLFGTDHLKSLLAGLESQGFAMILAGFGVLALIGLFISYRISVKILEKKEW